MKTNFFNKIDAFIGGKPTIIPVEKRILNYCSFISGIICLLSGVFNTFMSIPLTQIATVSSIIISFAFFGLSRFTKMDLKWLWALISSLVMMFFWITNQGMFGVYSGLFLVVIIIAQTIIRSSRHIIL